MIRTTISQVDLTKLTQEILNHVKSGEVIGIEQSGEVEMVLLNFLDFRLLEALAQCAITASQPGKGEENTDAAALRAYLAAEISLGKVAELLGLHRLDLQARLHRLGISLHLGPSTMEEAWAEIEAARKLAD
jgi:hypothetical protein